MVTDLEALAAMRRSDRALCEQVAAWEPLDYGVAYCSPAFPALGDANQLRDVWLADTDGDTAYQHADSYYRERHLTCYRWTPAAAQPLEEVEAVLLPKGWRRRDLTVAKLTDLALAGAPGDAAIRILPARAMPKAFRRTFANDGPHAETRAGLASERLNDSNYDVFVAMLDNLPAGRIGYLEVGDIARLADVFVIPEFRRRGVGLAMAAHFLRLVRRLLPRAVVACTEAENAGGLAFLLRCGFSAAGTLTEFERPSNPR
jgi:GNAT superfamily N-acetyltransferase